LKTSLIVFAASFALLAQFPGRGSKRPLKKKSADTAHISRFVRAFDAKSLDIEADARACSPFSVRETTKPRVLELATAWTVEATQDKDACFMR